MKLSFVLILVLIVANSAAWGQNKVVRDRNGTLVETWSQQGDSTDVRDHGGVLKEIRTRQGDNIEVRDRHGFF